MPMGNFSDNLNYNNSGTVTGDDLDNRIRQFSLDLQTILQQGGHNCPSTMDSKEGFHYVRSGYFRIYDSTIASALFELTDTVLNLTLSGANGLNLTGNLKVSGTATRAGNTLLDVTTHKRTIVLSAHGREGGTAAPLLKELAVYVPDTITSGKVKSLVVTRDNKNGARTCTIVQLAGAANWTANELDAAPSSGGATLATLALANNKYGIRSTGLSLAVAGGDLICCVDSLSGTGPLSFTVVIECDW